MARPKKEGLDYFPLDVYLDDKFKFIEIKYKLEGFAIVIKLLQKIYANGYYIDWGEDEELLFTGDIRSELDTVRNVVEECLKRDIFSREIYEKYKMLTSRGIQKRFMEATKKRTSITIKKELNLVLEEKTPVSVELTPVSEEKTPVNSTESTQSKVKESKVKESKVKESSNSQSNLDNLDNEAIELCKYYSTLLPGKDITKHLATLKIFIEKYGVYWTKEALQIMVSNKRDFIKNYMDAILKDWQSNGKKTVQNNNYKDGVKQDGFNSYKQRSYDGSDGGMTFDELEKKLLGYD